MLTENRYFSYNQGELPEGCKYCVRGEKLVLFVTGLCPRTCYFCPISDQKYGYDVIYANERKIKATEDIIIEARLMQAKGAGITGGDPLLKLERTVKYIKELKKAFGSSFHLHLYTSLNLATEATLAKLYEAGLDEIRFHLDFDDEIFWKNIFLAKKFSWKVGAELPCIPTKILEMKKIADLISRQVDFLNLNELERADNKHSSLDEAGFKTIHPFSYATEGSVKAGLEIAQYVKEKRYAYSVHICTAKLKENVQLRNRMKREAVKVKKSFDKVDREGILTRGALYLPELAPGFNYRNKLESFSKEEFEKRNFCHKKYGQLPYFCAEMESLFHFLQDKYQNSPNGDKNSAISPPLENFAYKNINYAKFSKEKIIAVLQQLLEKIKKECSLSDADLLLDREKPRILLSEFQARKFKKKLKASGLLVAVVQEMPTADQLEIEVEFL